MQNNQQSTINNQQNKNLSGILQEKAGNILEKWEEQVRLEVEAARHLHSSDLKNSLPKFLENLAHALEHREGNVKFEAKVAREHGKERSTFPRYTLEQIISEYRILRRAIFSVLGEVPPQERDAIIDAIELGIAEAASEFAGQQYQLREKFISTLAHDLRTPLTVAKTSAQLILRAPEKANSTQVMASRIVNTIDRTDRMIKDLLDANLSQMGQKLHLEIEECDLRSIGQMAIEDATSISGDNFFLKSDSFVMGYWDPMMLQRAIGNLLSNATKYGTPGALVNVTITQEENQARIAIHNEGKPIPEDEQEEIFDNFYRSVTAKSGLTQGWGIGLFLVKAAATAHGGTVQVQSGEKTGTTFTIILPTDCRLQKIEEGERKAPLQH